MTNEPDTLARLVAYHDHIAAPPFEVADDVRRGRRRVRRNRGLLTGGVALAVAGVAVAASLLDGRLLVDRPQPVAPRPSEISPSPATTTGWSGPLRLGAALPMIPVDSEWDIEDQAWADGPDAAFGGIDIVGVKHGGWLGSYPQAGWARLAWSFGLREAPPRAAALDPTHRVIEYGLVVDADGDRVADCQIGINNDAPTAGDYRVWVTNLKTGVTDERVGGPYGYPIEFSHPDEERSGDPLGWVRTMSFNFLSGTEPCDPLPRSASFYAWASVTEDGRVTAWDYAPDAAWLAMSL